MLDDNLCILDEFRARCVFITLINKIYNLNKDFFIDNKFSSLSLPQNDDEVEEYELFEEFFSTLNIEYFFTDHYLDDNGKEYEPTEDDIYSKEPDCVSSNFLIYEYELCIYLYNYILNSSIIPESIRTKISSTHVKYKQDWVDLQRDFDSTFSSIYDYADGGVTYGVILHNDFIVSDLSCIFMVLGIYIQAFTLIPIYKSILRKYKIDHNYIKKDGKYD